MIHDKLSSPPTIRSRGDKTSRREAAQSTMMFIITTLIVVALAVSCCCAIDEIRIPFSRAAALSSWFPPFCQVQNNHATERWHVCPQVNALILDERPC